MTDTTDFNFNNNTHEQRSFDVIPPNTICTLHMTIRPGGAGDGGWLKTSADGASEGLDCEFTITSGQHAKRKLWQLFTLRGKEPGHATAGEISRDTLRAILESARGINPHDTSEAAQNTRKVSGWQDFDGLRFIARLGVRPPQDNWPAKNTILKVITPDKQDWQKPEQISAEPANGGAPAAVTTPPANAIARPQWSR